MIVVVQRVARAALTAERDDGAHESAIGRGLVALVGVERGDGPAQADWMANKLAALRIFPDENGKMNLSPLDISAAVLVVSQFTLAGELRKGTRPNFMRAAPPDQAEPLVERVAERLESEHGVETARGVFGATMRIELVNEGPVTLILERRADE